MGDYVGRSRRNRFGRVALFSNADLMGSAPPYGPLAPSGTTYKFRTINLSGYTALMLVANSTQAAGGIAGLIMEYMDPETSLPAFGVGTAGVQMNTPPGGLTAGLGDPGGNAAGVWNRLFSDTQGQQGAVLCLMRVAILVVSKALTINSIKLYASSRY